MAAAKMYIITNGSLSFRKRFNISNLISFPFFKKISHENKERSETSIGPYHWLISSNGFLVGTIVLDVK